MTKTIKQIGLLLIALAVSFNLNAQDALSLITENPDRVANNMHAYEFCEIYDTPAPKGFKPFYISHYGRHGSRYEQNSKFGDPALKIFHILDSLNLLTPIGKQLYSDVKTIQDAHVGMEGSLTPRGAQEHKMLAARMADRYPSVFTDNSRQEVNSFSSTNFRCIVSMCNFTNSLKEKFPKQEFTFTSAEKYMKYLNPSLRPKNAPAVNPYANMQRPARPTAPAAPATPKAPGYDYTRFYAPLFTDQAAALAYIPDQDSFVEAIFKAGSYSHLIDFLGIDILRKYFSPQELVFFWQSWNNSIYRMWGGSTENGETIRYAIRPLLMDFVEKADAAMTEGSHRAADLRFGHDTSILPLFALLGVDDPQHRVFSFNEASNKNWYAFFQVPMATNIQMVFYRNKKGDVLTKILYNEKEVMLPGIEPVSGPYYDWNKLRTHFISLCTED